jgi:hypothetical protein
VKQAICFADLALKLTCLTTDFPSTFFFLLTLVFFYMSLNALCISRFLPPPPPPVLLLAIEWRGRWLKGETRWMKSGCSVSAAFVCINKEMSKVTMEGTVNAALRSQDAGEVRRKRVGGLAEVMCLLSGERVDTCLFYCLKTLVARPVQNTVVAQPCSEVK